MDVVNLLFNFRGRTGRGHFWLATLIYLIVCTIAAAIGFAIDSMAALIGAVLIASVPCMISGVFVGIKRLHDRNKSGWWLVVFYLLPAVLPWFGLLFPGGGGGDMESLPISVMALYYLRFALYLWALVELGCLRGTIGANPYGPDPVAPKPAKH